MNMEVAIWQLRTSRVIFWSAFLKFTYLVILTKEGYELKILNFVLRKKNFYVMFKATEVCLAFLFAFNGFIDNLLLFNF